MSYHPKRHGGVHSSVRPSGCTRLAPTSLAGGDWRVMVGTDVGADVGMADGSVVGDDVGRAVGIAVGNAEGGVVGVADGSAVGVRHEVAALLEDREGHRRLGAP